MASLIKFPPLSKFAPFAARDLLLAATGAGLWMLDRAMARRHRGIAIAAGIGAGVTAFLAHEWGHLLGAAASGGVVHRPKSLLSPFLFFFDTEHSNREQFLAMSAGGFAATAVATTIMLKTVPRAALSGKVALAMTALGVGVTVLAEVPVALSVWRGGPLPHGGVYAGRG